MKIRTAPINFCMIALLSVALLTQTGCGGTTIGNPEVSIQFTSYTAFNVMDWLVPSAYATLSNGKICVRRLRFKTDINSTEAEDGIDFQPGEISLNATGSGVIGTVTVPSGVYRRVEFDLTNNGAGCTSGHSVSFTNSNGTYTSTDNTTIKFEGTFDASAAHETLSLGLQGIINALNTINGPSGNNATIASTLQNASVKGNF